MTTTLTSLIQHYLNHKSEYPQHQQVKIERQIKICNHMDVDVADIHNLETMIYPFQHLSSAELEITKAEIQKKIDQLEADWEYVSHEISRRNGISYAERFHELFNF